MQKVKVTDPELLAALSGSTPDTKGEEADRSRVTDPQLLKLLNDGEEPTKAPSPVSVEEAVEDMPDYAMEYTSPWEYLEGVSEAVGALARGAAAGVSGLGGDIESLGRMLFADKDSQETLLPTSEDMRGNINTLIGAPKPNQLQQEGIEAFNLMGNVLAPVATTAKVITKGSKFIADKTAKSERIRKALLDPVEKYAGELATVKLGVKGDVIKDPVGQKLVDLDVNPETVSYVTNTDKANKKSMAEILERTVKGVDNDMYKSAKPATEVLGNTVLKRLSALSTKRKALGAKLDEVVNNELKSLQFPVAPLNVAFKTAVKKTFDVGMGGLDKLPRKTKRNLMELDRLIAAQSNTGTLTGKQMHSLKRILDDLRDVGAKDNMSRGVDKVIGDLRKSVNTQLGEASPAYRSVNEKLAKVLNTESSFVRLDGTREFANDEALRNIVGTKLKGLGNSSVGLNSQWQDALKNLDETLAEMGIKFKDDPVLLSNFAVRANQFANINDATILRYGNKEAKRSAIKGAAAGGVGNVFGAINNTSNLVSMGIEAKNAEKALKAHRKAYEVMMKELK